MAYGTVPPTLAGAYDDGKRFEGLRALWFKPPEGVVLRWMYPLRGDEKSFVSCFTGLLGNEPCIKREAYVESVNQFECVVISTL